MVGVIFQFYQRIINTSLSFFDLIQLVHAIFFSVKVANNVNFVLCLVTGICPGSGFLFTQSACGMAAVWQQVLAVDARWDSVRQLALIVQTDDEAIQTCNCIWIICELLPVLCHFFPLFQVQCLPHAYLPTVPNSVHPPTQPAAQRERQVWLWARAAQAVPEAAQSAAGPALRAPVWAEQLQGQQCAQLPHHTGPNGGQTQRNRKGRKSRTGERVGGCGCTNLGGKDFKIT